MTLTTQFYTLITMIAMGCYFGAALDTYNRFLKRSKKKNWLVFVNDFLFWLVQGLLIFYALFLVNEGEMRPYLFLALLCGFAAYQALVKSIYMKILEWVISFFVSTVKFINKTTQAIIFRPVKWLLGSLIFLIVGILKGLFTLVKLLCKVVISILSLALKPLFGIFGLLWNIVPNFIRKRLETFFRKFVGFFLIVENYIKNKLVYKWKKK